MRPSRQVLIEEVERAKREHMFICPWCNKPRKGAQFLIGQKKHKAWVCNSCYLEVQYPQS